MSDTIHYILSVKIYIKLQRGHSNKLGIIAWTKFQIKNIKKSSTQNL
jgi:hypothetical protein